MCQFGPPSVNRCGQWLCLVSNIEKVFAGGVYQNGFTIGSCKFSPCATVQWWFRAFTCSACLALTCPLACITESSSCNVCWHLEQWMPTHLHDWVIRWAWWRRERKVQHAFLLLQQVLIAEDLTSLHTQYIILQWRALQCPASCLVALSTDTYVFST